MKSFSASGEIRVDGQRRRRGTAAIWLLTLFVLAVAGQGFAQLTVNPITWDVVGLDHNRPLTSGPELFPVGAEVCSATATTNVTVDFIWTDGNDNGWDVLPGDDYINLRPGSLTSLTFASIGAGECVDAYFELKLNRSASAFDDSRQYTIEATDPNTMDTASTPSPRAIYIERLVSQNRNTTQQIRYGQQADQSDWVVLGAGGGINLAIDETYFIELTTQTATAYEELESFITLSNTIFQVISVSTTYGVQTAPLSRVPDPNPQLWADGCLWDSDPDSPNYLSCLEDGKAGGVVVTIYEIRIISGGGDSVGLEALIYDRSGGSFHYNSDYSESPGDLNTIDPADADFSKRFIPSTIGADGVSTLRFTVTNPNPLPVSGYLFDDSLPGDMVVAAAPNVSNTCGGTVTASAGAATISLAGGSLDANSSCTILVDVTVPFDGAATYPLTLDNSVDLFVGTATDPSATAAASLEVTEEPPPPLDCTAVAAGTTLAAWATFNSAATPSPTTEYTAGIAAAQGGSGLTLSVSNDNLEWRANAQVTGQTLANAISTNAYYEFRLDTTGIDSIDFSLEAFRRNGNAPASLTLRYGPAGSLVQSTTFSPVPTQNNRPGVNNFQATGLTNLNPSGDTLFRVYAYGASNANQPVSLLNILIQGEGTICAPVDPSTAPDPPTISKAFSPTSVRVGAVSTLTFTIANPNAADALTGVTFRDELPSGMTAVSGTFVNSCGTGTWGPDGGDLTIPLFTGGQLAASASCTLAVNVVSSTVGPNVNVSNPVDAVETLPGGTAVATLTVLPPPAPPLISKQFVPNPLLDPTGSTILTFRITNADPSLDISSVAFVDPLPAGMQPVTPLAITDNGECGVAYSLTWNGGTGELTFSGGAITADTVCGVTIEVEVPGVDVSGGPVTFANQTGLVSHVFNGTTYEGNDAEATLVVDNPIPGVAILKQVGLGSDPDGPWSDYLAVAAGTGVYYKLTVENIGETVLTNMAVSDPTVNISSCTWPASLPVADGADPLAHIAVCIVGPVTAVAGTNTNTAGVVTDEVSGPTTDSASYATVELTLDKSASPLFYTAAGDVITYTFTVTNAGSATLPGPVTISDALVPGASCPDLTTIGNFNNLFNPAEEIDCTGSYTILAADVTAGSVPNTATATVDGFDSPEDSTSVTLAVASLTIAKTQTSGPDPTTAAGDVLGYTIVITNTGTVSQTGVTVTDTLPDATAGTLTGPTESVTTNSILDVGETWTYTISYTVTQADIDAGAALVNTASVVTTEVPGPTTNTESTPVTQSATLTIAKTQTSGPDPTTAAGDVLGYTIVITNTGTVSQTGVTVTDTLPDATAGTLTGPTESVTTNSILDVGETWTYTISYTVTQADIDAGTALVNTANVVTTEVPGPTTDTESTPVTQSATLTIAKTQTSGPDPTTAAGDVLGYTIVITNTGTVSQTGVTVTDTLPDATAGTLTGPTESVTTNSILDVGETWTYTISYTVTQADIDAGTALVNTASVVTTEVPGPTTNTESTPVTQSATLTIAKTQTSGPDPTTAAGDVLGYTIVITNTGTVSQTGVTVTDTLPDSSAGTLTGPTESVTTNSILDVGETWTYTISYTVTQADIDAGSALVNTASVVTTEVPGPTTNTETTPVTPTASLTIAKTQTSGPDPTTAAGDVLGYTIVITNTGTVSQTGVTVTDTLPDATAGTLTGPTESVTTNSILDVGETWTYTISYTVTQANIDAGAALVNTASVVTTEVPGPTTNTESTPVTQSATLTIAKTQTSGPDPTTAAGDVLGYTIVITNTGTVSQTGVTVTDTLPDATAGTLTGPTESVTTNSILDVGETWTYTISYTVTQADIDAGTALVNTANVVTTEVPGPTTDTESTPVTQSATLTIAKTQTSGPDPTTAAGDVLGYTIVITNTGTVSQSGVTVTDTLPDATAGTLTGPTESVTTNSILDVGETWTYTISYTVTQANIDAGAALVNTASVVTTEVPGPTTNTESTPVTQSATLTIAKTQTSGPDPTTAAGDVLGYTIVITNTGTVSQTGVTVTDTLPDATAGTLTGPTESVTTNSILDVGETWTYTISYTVTQADIDAGTALVNTASVVTTEVPGPTTNTESTPVTQSATLTIAKTQTSGPDPTTAAGDVLGYTIVITNTGTVSQSGVTVTDTLPDATAGTLTGPTESVTTNSILDVGETWTYTISYTVTQADIDAGTALVNTANVVTTEVPGPTTNTETTPVTPAASLTIAKTQTSGPDPATTAGDVLGYTIVVTNTGTVSQSGVTVTDTLPDATAGTLTGPTESVTTNSILDVGETWTYTISYTVTQSDIDAGNALVNTASVVTTEVPGPTTDTETTPVTQSAVTVSASKVSLPGDGTPVATGDTITYALVVAVSNGSTTADTVLTDTLGSGLTYGSVTNNPGGFIAGGSGNDRTFTLPSGSTVGTYLIEYSAMVNLDATGSTVNNNLLIAGGGDPDPDCTSCSTDHPLESEVEAIPTTSTWGIFLMIALLAGAAALRLRSV